MRCMRMGIQRRGRRARIWHCARHEVGRRPRRFCLPPLWCRQRSVFCTGITEATADAEHAEHAPRFVCNQKHPAICRCHGGNMNFYDIPNRIESDVVRRAVCAVLLAEAGEAKLLSEKEYLFFKQNTTFTARPTKI